MISVENFKLLEDLKEELASQTKRLENLKESKKMIMNEVAIKLLRRIQLYLDNVGLKSENRDDHVREAFTCIYKQGYISGQVFKDSNEISISINGEVGYSFIVVPSPVDVRKLGQVEPKKDSLTNEIVKARKKIIKNEGLIKSFENNNFVYAIRNEDSLTVIGDKDKVLAKIFL